MAALAATPASAACTTFTPASNDTVVCTGSNNTGVIGTTSDGVSVTVQSGGSIAPLAGKSIHLRNDANITIEAGATVGNPALATYSIDLGEGAVVDLRGLIQSQGGITGPVQPSAGGLTGFKDAVVTIGPTGQILTNGVGFAALNGRGGGNVYYINGSIRATSNSGTGVQVGADDNLTIGAGGSIVTLGGDTSDAIDGFAMARVTVNVLEGAAIELHGIGRGVQLGDNASVTFGGNLVSLGDNAGTNTSGGVGIEVGINSFVHLTSTGTITTGNNLGLGNQGRGGWGINTFSTAGSNATVIVDGTITTRLAHGIFSGAGDQIAIGETGRITVQTGTSHGIFGNLFTSPTINQHSIVVGGRVEALGTGSAIFLQADNAQSGVEAAQLMSSISILEHGSLFAQNAIVYNQLDGCCGFPAVIDNLIVAGTVERGTAGTIINLDDGADTLTLLPTYSFRANGAPGGTINGGTNTSGPENDTFVLAGALGTDGSFDFSINPLVNFETGRKLGGGIWRLAGNSGAGISGNFTVEAGRLNVDGTLPLGLVVQSGATLGGSGSAATFHALAGSIVAPGNSIGTLTVATASFASGSVLEVELNPTTSDLLEVTGTATVASGATVFVVPEAGTYTLGQEYLILRAGTRIGLFDGVSDNSAFLEFTLDHSKDPDEVWLRVAQVVNFPAVAQTPNQLATAQALQELGAASPLGAAVAPLGAATALVAFDQLSGELHASTARALIEDSRIPREAALDRVGAAFAAIEAMQAAGGRNVWVRPVGSAGVVRTDGNAASMGIGTGGMLAGADGILDGGTLLGLTAGVTLHSLSIPERNSAASAAGVHLGVYGGHDFDPLLFKFGSNVSLYGIRTVRTPAFATFADTASADYAAATVQAFAELSHAFELENGTVEPFLRLVAIGHAGSGYSETGGASALSGNVTPNLSGIATIGVNGTTQIPLADDSVIEVKGSIGWEQHIGATSAATHAFAGGSPFSVSSVGYGSALVAEGSARLATSDTSSLTLTAKSGLGATGTFGSILATFSGSF